MRVDATVVVVVWPGGAAALFERLGLLALTSKLGDGVRVAIHYLAADDGYDFHGVLILGLRHVRFFSPPTSYATSLTRTLLTRALRNWS